MSVFERSKEQTENEVMIRLLEQVEENPRVSQRFLSTKVGIAFGLVNAYLKRSIEKGWVRVKNVSPKRYAYFVTPDGFREKSRMIKEYMTYSLAFFRQSKAEADLFFDECSRVGHQKIAIMGSGDLSDILFLVGKSYACLCVEVIPANADPQGFHAVFIGCLENPQEVYERARKSVSVDRIYILSSLAVIR